MNIGFIVVCLICISTMPMALPAAQEKPTYRTTVPKITPERWTKPLPALPERRKVTREDYLEYIKEKWLPLRESALKQMNDPNQHKHWESARREAFFYRITGDEQYARNAMGLIRSDYRFRTEGPGKDFKKHHASCVNILPSATAYHWIRKSRSLTEDDHELARKWLLLLINNYAYYECGAMNRGIGGSGCVMVANHWYPDTADDPLTCATRLEWLKDRDLTRKEYVDYAWNHWWQFRDTYENSAGYVSHSLQSILTVLELTDQLGLLGDPGMKRFAERYLAQVAPNGAMPGYGDGASYSTSPGRWVWFFEAMAAVTKDGRYKWAAHRFFEFLRRHEKDFEQWSNPIYWEMDNLMEAYLVADESVEPVEPHIGSVITYRKDLRWLDQQATGRHAELLDRDIPNKLILRTGWGPGDTFALVDLCKPMSHGHANTGSIDCYVSEDSVLLAAPSYLIRSHPFHNCLVVWPNRRPEGFQWGRDVLHAGRCEVQVKAFHTTPGAAYAHIHMTDYMNGPTTLDRRVFFLGRRGMWVRDTVTAAEPFAGTVGPAFQFVGVYPKKGENWANACQASVPVSFIWTDEYMMQFTNRPMDLLVYYAPKAGAKLAIDDVTFDNSEIQYKQPVHNNFTDRVWYQMDVEWAGGQSETFDSILLPHKPLEDATPLAEGIEPILDGGPDRAVIKIDQDDGTSLYVGINTAGAPLLAGPVGTDARWFTVSVGPEGLSCWVVEGTSLQVDGRRVLSSRTRTTQAKVAPRAP